MLRTLYIMMSLRCVVAMVISNSYHSDDIGTCDLT